MASTFHESETGQAIIENTMEAGTERLVVTLHPESGFSVDFEFHEGIEGNALIASSGISIDRAALQKLAQWLREQGALD
ncbi:hypothetical protein [Noviherbaspirillum saxi]|uniref:Uncharacterized protein n=1 Tax=Noviherbaspirillum saxi TaxID=2320863 RepID=A0A3A3FLY9_9BURK|nr:hypothetical protein [Noviherbaspirillum saxi]RJF95495.1 hypothetical protein D3871_19020 [Noviherbaspirillum saxi]